MRAAVQRVARKILSGSPRMASPVKLLRRKLTAAQIDFIVAELARGRRTPELARDFRVDPSTIRKVRIKNRARIAAARRAERRARDAA